MKIYCKRCFDILGEEEKYIENIKKYIDSLDDSIKVTENLYKKRLEQCSKCRELINGMCRYCGCFVIVRASKKKMKCPNPKYDYWDLD